MSSTPDEYRGLKIIDIPALTDMELLEVYEDGMWAAHALDLHGDGLFPIRKIVYEDTGRPAWQMGEEWTSFDEARATAAEYAAHVLPIQDPEVRDIALVRHFVSSTMVRVDVQ